MAVRASRRPRRSGSDEALAAYRRALEALATLKVDYANELWANRESFRAEVGAAYLGFTDLLLRTQLFGPNGLGTSLIDDLQGDVFLNSLYGAIVSGIGYGLVYRARGTSGGTDILARILNHWRGVSLSQSYLMTDALIIFLAGLTFCWEKALYALIVLYASGIAAEERSPKAQMSAGNDHIHVA